MATSRKIFALTKNVEITLQRSNHNITMVTFTSKPDEAKPLEEECIIYEGDSDSPQKKRRFWHIHKNKTIHV